MNPLKLQQQVATAMATLQWLIGHGFTPLNQQAGDFPKPVILIEACGKCDFLRRAYAAEVIGRGSNALGTYANWQADVRGCLVVWMEVVNG